MCKLDGGTKHTLVVKVVHKATMIQFGAMKNVELKEVHVPWYYS